MKALILAGGRGSRLNEFTKNMNKSMIKLFEKPLIEYNLNHAVESGVSEIVIVVGYKKEEIINYIGKDYRGIPVNYTIQKEQKGLVNAIECAREKLGNSDFILMLGDEIIPEAKMKEMIKKFKDEELFAVCGVVNEKDKFSVGKTYSAMINERGRVFRLIEKPKVMIYDIKGTGHCVLKNEILDYIERTPISANRGEKELVDLIQVAIDDGKKVYVQRISKNGYVNINTKEDFELAKGLIKNSNPKVLIVHTQMKFLGGAELLIIELCNWLTKRGIKNDILALSSSKEVQNKLIDTEIIIPKHNIDLRPPGFKNTKDILKFVRIYRKKIKKILKNYDIINFHNFPVTWTLFPSKKPCVWMLNEPPNLWSKPQANFFLRFMNKLRNRIDKEIVKDSVDIICVADDLNRQRAKERYKRDARIIYYGINYDFFSNGKACKAIKKFDIKNNFIITQSGMITKTKNQFESIKTINNIKDKIPNILLIIAGEIADREYKEKIDEYIKRKRLEKNVLFTGNLSREDLRDLYKASNVGLFPIGKQGGWLAPFEFLCSGNPVIISKDMGAASVIKQFNLGITTEKYSDALIEVYKNSEKYQKEGIQRKKLIKKNFGWDIFADKMIKAYKDAWRRDK